MAGEPKPNRLKPLALASVMVWAVCCQAQTVRHHQERIETDAVSPEVSQAEAAIEKQDYATAERLLLPYVAGNPKDAMAWYDLGFVYKATKRRPEAIDAYKKSLDAKPDLYESNLNLGVLLAQENKNDDAARYMRVAVKLMPASAPAAQKSMNWMRLGEVEEKSNRDAALAAFRRAEEFAPKDASPHIRAGHLLAENKDVPGSEKEYKTALELSPQNKDALAGLIDLYQQSDRVADANVYLREYAKQFPQDPKVHLMLGQSLLKSGDTQGAVAEFDEGLKQSPGDVGLLHEVASMYAAQKKFDVAAPRFAELVKAAPDKGEYHYQYGVVLMQLHKFPEAQEQLIAALQRDPKLTEAYGELAVAASENKQYALVIKVLDTRGQIALETPATFFLRATAYDNLKAFPQAAENYHKFLETSNGQFPDNEWKARHRLLAIEPEGSKKKK